MVLCYGGSGKHEHVPFLQCFCSALQRPGIILSPQQSEVTALALQKHLPCALTGKDLAKCHKSLTKLYSKFVQDGGLVNKCSAAVLSLKGRQ